jgi:hypothetical protein
VLRHCDRLDPAIGSPERTFAFACMRATRAGVPHCGRFCFVADRAVSLRAAPLRAKRSRPDGLAGTFLARCCRQNRTMSFRRLSSASRPNLVIEDARVDGKGAAMCVLAGHRSFGASEQAALNGAAAGSGRSKCRQTSDTTAAGSTAKAIVVARPRQTAPVWRSNSCAQLDRGATSHMKALPHPESERSLCARVHRRRD